MADITNSVTNVSQMLSDFIFWLTNFTGKIITGIGPVEIVLFLLIGVAIYFFFNQHNLQPVRIRRF